VKARAGGKTESFVAFVRSTTSGPTNNDKEWWRDE
jgi:hypothetical protein